MRTCVRREFAHHSTLPRMPHIIVHAQRHEILNIECRSVEPAYLQVRSDLPPNGCRAAVWRAER